MSSSDWWTSSSPSNTFYTPQRPSSVPLTTSTRARFQGDELDPDDARMADGIKFAPSFASSAAGKAILGQSPGVGTVGRDSPPSARRSPQTRFGPESVGSVRNAGRSSRRSPITPMHIDEDLPPTASLRDSINRPSPSMTSPTPAAGPSQGGQQSALTPASSNSQSSSSYSDPVVPSLLANAGTTRLHVFGPPLDQMHELGPYFEQIGPVSSYSPGPDGSNWWIVEFVSPISAQYALRRHGEIINGRWMLGLKVAGPGSEAGLTLVDGIPPPSNNVLIRGANGGEIQRTTNGSMGGIGTPIRIQQNSVFKVKPVAVKKTGEQYAWDENEAPSGIINKAADWLFGR